MRSPSRVLVLVSGGLDSVTALYHARQSYAAVSGLSFDYGAKHNHREIPLAQWHCRRLSIPHRVVRIDAMADHFRSDLLKTGGPIPAGPYLENGMRQTVVPFRNGVMLALAAGLAESLEADSVLIAAHGGDHALYPDCREDFMNKMGAAIRAGTYAQIALLRPFIDMNKTDIVRRARHLGVDLARTWSCYVGGERHCGVCGTCLERRGAFRDAGMVDPTEYESAAPAVT